MEQTKLFSDNTDFGNMDRSFFLVGLINRFNNGFQAVADAMFEEISWKQAFFVNCITLFKQPPTIKEMAQIIGCSHQNANQILTKLEKMAFVQLRQDPADRRKQRITLTPKAEEWRRRYDSPSQAAMQVLFHGVDAAALDTTVQVITRLTNNLQQIQTEERQ